MADLPAFWHPFSDMSRVIGHEVELDHGDGVWLTDARGRRYLDGTAGLWFANVGHGRAEIADAAAAQMKKLAAYSTFDVYSNAPATALAERLAQLSPLPDTAVFLTSGGSDSVDSAAKIARRYWQVRGQPDRTFVVARSEAYHGMHGFGTSLAGIEANANGWGPLVNDVLHVPNDDVDALADLFDRYAGRIAAFIGEPVIGAGGVIPPAEDYWKRVSHLCAERDVLLIADEVVTGYGRLGTWFACEQFGIEPDLITSAKGLTSGYLPLGAVLVGPKVREVLWSPEAGMFRHGYTYSGHPVGAQVALTNLDIIEREDLLGNVSTLAPVLAEHLRRIGEHPLVRETRTVGLLGAIELRDDVEPSRPRAIELLVERLRERGILVRGLVGHSIQISPPFIITADELGVLFSGIEEQLDAMNQSIAVGAVRV